MPEQVLLKDDPQAFLNGLVRAVAQILPPTVLASALTVERRRSLIDHLTGGEGSISRIRLVTGGYTMELDCSAGQNFSTETRRVVRGIVVSRRSQNLREWLEAFAGRVAVLSGRVASDGRAPVDALQALGISVSAPGVTVSDDTVLDDLRALPFKVRGSIPPDSAAAVGRIVDFLLETLPRVASDFEANALAHRTATVYLPETLRAYLDLPADWARSHVYPDGSTPESALFAQLQILERASRRMQDAAIRGDANTLLINGEVLGYRFGDPHPPPAGTPQPGGAPPEGPRTSGSG